MWFNWGSSRVWRKWDGRLESLKFFGVSCGVGFDFFRFLFRLGRVFGLVVLGWGCLRIRGVGAERKGLLFKIR